METLPISILAATTGSHLQGIMALQRSNLAETLSSDEKREQGFVTVRHSEAQLWEMTRSVPQFIALVGERVVGYVLTMDRSLQHTVPILQPMFAEFENIPYGSGKIPAFPYIVCGQACVEKVYRGKGLLKKLYGEMKARLAPSHHFCITEVAVDNAPSMIAHERTGFRTVHTYSDGKKDWNIVLWDWRG